MEEDKDDESEERFEMVIYRDRSVHTNGGFDGKGTNKSLIDKRNG